MKWGIFAVALLAGALGGAPRAAAQQPGTGDVVATTPIAPFALVGYIEDFHIAPQAGADLPHAGGTMTVNGTKIVIPDNTVIVMPASQLTVYDIFNKRPKVGAADPGGLVNNVSGLALNDPPPYAPLAAYEVSITGNVVNGQYVAGLITMAQELAMVHQGYITNIDYATGDFCVGSATPPAGGAPSRSGCRADEVRIKLNDPVGRFGKKRTDQDPRFAVDDGNPTVRTTTGYPMCVPRIDPKIANDALCPRNNRPIVSDDGLPLTRFVMDTSARGPNILGAVAPLGATLIPPCPTCDSRQQVPLMVGDNVAFNGTLARDAKGDFISAWQVVDTLGVFTKPCGVLGYNPLSNPTGAIVPGGPGNGLCNPLTDMAYIEWEVGIVGTQGTIVDGALVEGQDRIRIEGMTTDPSHQIEVYAITSNPGNPPVAGSGDPLQDGNLRWIGNVEPLVIPFGRFTLFVQRDIVKRLPFPVTSGPIPIISDPNTGFDYGAPRQLYVRLSDTMALLGGTNRRHNVKPVPAGFPNLHGTPVPTPNDVVDAAGRVRIVANGLVPGQYFQPVQAYITAEAVQIGDPLVPNNFECMDFLVYGWNVTTPSFPHGITMGQLNPWPGGLPSAVGLDDGAQPPRAVRCASTVPPAG